MARSTTGKLNHWGRIPALPADHPLFKAGFVIGQRRAASSTTTTQPAPDPDAPLPEKPAES